MSSTVNQHALNRIAARLGSILGSHGQKIVTAESCTGGWIAQTLTAIPGSSSWFEAGFVTYSNAMKQSVLQVPADYLQGPEAPGAVSEQTVLAMARGALTLADADWAVATSGIAGPGGATPGKPVGLVWIGWASHNIGVASAYNFVGSRDQVRRQAVAAALEGLLQRLQGPAT
ncbi:CinA family protein [Gammaproteobacteria bacterium LSUCC0112]|nr:CinA family protein [Gammaproteobacteria bacterium LSUCC0112]